MSEDLCYLISSVLSRGSSTFQFRPRYFLNHFTPRFFPQPQVKMDSTDMFGFLSGPAPEGDQSIPVDRPKKKKRKHVTAPEPAAAEEPTNGASTMDVDGDRPEHVDGEDDEEPALKKLRIDEPAAVVTDEFETEAKREVKADAGLTGGQADGAKLVLTHHVCLLHFIMCLLWG